MKPEDIIYMAGMLVIAALLTFVVIKTSSPINVELNGYSMQKTDIFQGDVADFAVLGARFASTHTYSNENGSKYNCINYSNDLAYIAKQLGFKVEVIEGWPEGNGTGHRWLRLAVDYEPQDGQFVDYSMKYPNQGVIDE
jgi:hypothetical protein